MIKRKTPSTKAIFLSHTLTYSRILCIFVFSNKITYQLRFDKFLIQKLKKEKKKGSETNPNASLLRQPFLAARPEQINRKTLRSWPTKGKFLGSPFFPILTQDKNLAPAIFHHPTRVLGDAGEWF